VPDEPTEIRLGMSREEAYDFLRRLAEDDEFRTELEANPREVLARYRVTISPDEAIPVGAKLPPKELVQDLLQEMGEPDQFGRVSPEALGYGFLVFFWRVALPFVEHDVERHLVRDGAR
jgi:hypothetical protein